MAESPLKLVSADDSPPSCGDHGGRNNAGEPCRRPPGWGLEGDEGPCKDHIHAAELPEGARPPPDHLSPESAALWREIVGLYQFGAEGYPLLQDALEARDRAAAAREEIQRTGLMFVNKDSGTPHPNPLLRVERDSWTAFRLAWKQLDLDVPVPEEAP